MGATLKKSLLLLGSLTAVAVCIGTPKATAEKVDVYLGLDEAPAVMFPEADSIERKDVQVDTALRQRMKKLIGRLKPSIWEPFYISFIARKDGNVIGYAVVCEEIGKHRPITFIVAVTPEGTVRDTAVMMYREAIGAEVRYKSFLKQFQKKGLENPIMPRRDIKNITGATLSVRAMSRGVRKALAFVQLVYLDENTPQEAEQ